MAVKVGEYLDYLRQAEYPHLFSDEDMKKLENVEKTYGGMETEETILEVCLSAEETGCDYSIRIDKDSDTVSEYWYELDSAACEMENIPECYFLDAGNVKTGEDNSHFYDTQLIKLTGGEVLERLKPMLENCVNNLKGKCDRLFQLGYMAGRNDLNRIRLFTDDMTRESLIFYLEEMDWQGNVDALNAFLISMENHSDKKKFILDFDIAENEISKKIGINFGTADKRTDTVKKLLELFCETGLCREQKKEDVLKFISRFPAHTPFIQNDISHFKIPFMDDEPLMAKAYLRQGSVMRHIHFKAYDTPVLMNLELTSKCPLRCPQCYCDLSKGEDLEESRAVYWLHEAKKNNIKTVNLSGGETLIYPHLDRLIKTGSDLGMEMNIAISGYGATKERLKPLIESGVSYICVSLNGSTGEINSYSRDGYDLAVNALKVLKKMEYPKTCINWVMHSNNADDFMNMIRLAESYKVSTLVVMVFKPDSHSERPSVPTGKQIFSVAEQIKSYKGELKIEVEECFSQMRAVLGKRFFTNYNVGIAKGCGAGRDGISISVDGKITPCRHLEIKEEFASIKEYWEKSETLKHLRAAEDNMESPCTECDYRRNCLPCMAVNWKLKGKISMGEESCTIGGCCTNG